MSASAPQGWLETEKDAVLAQLDRILEHAAFKHSQRSARFLRYVVEHSLFDDHEARPLKERTLGAELFGLDPAYDTSQNTVVRNAATDVRKRIAMYYQEPGHENEIQIELPAGSYIPCFHASPQTIREEAVSLEASLAADGVLNAHLAPDISVPSPPERKKAKSSKFVFLSAAAVLLIIAIALLTWKKSVSLNNLPVSRLADMSELGHFWQPVLDDSAPEPVILVCVGDMPRSSAGGQELMPVGDAFATADFARWLGTKDKRFRIAVAGSISITDLQPATVLLVGGADNPWTLYATEDLRFHFSAKSDSVPIIPMRIEDRKNPSGQDWSLNSSSTAGSVQDYALVAPVHRSQGWPVARGRRRP